MRSFLQGLLWGGMVGTVVGAIIGPMNKTQQKPVKKLLKERSAEAVVATTERLIKQARRARRRLVKKLDA